MKYLRVAGIISRLDHQFMDSLQFVVQGPVEGNDTRFDIHDKVAVRVTLAPVDFIKDQTVISLIFIRREDLREKVRHRSIVRMQPSNDSGPED